MHPAGTSIWPPPRSTPLKFVEVLPLSTIRISLTVLSSSCARLLWHLTCAALLCFPRICCSRPMLLQAVHLLKTSKPKPSNIYKRNTHLRNVTLRRPSTSGTRFQARLDLRSQLRPTLLRKWVALTVNGGRRWLRRGRRRK